MGNDTKKDPFREIFEMVVCDPRARKGVIQILNAMIDATNKIKAQFEKDLNTTEKKE